MINFYKLHRKRYELYGHRMALDKVPHVSWEFFYNKFINGEIVFSERVNYLQDRENIWAKSAYLAFNYSMLIQQRFLMGENIIRKNFCIWQIYKNRWKIES